MKNAGAAIGVSLVPLVKWSDAVLIGKRFCKHSPSISEQQIKDAICARLGPTTFDERVVKKHIGFISIQSDGTLEVEMQQLGLSLS